VSVQRTDLQVRREATSGQPVAVVTPAQLSWATPARWRNVGRGDLPQEQPSTLARSGRGPPAA
jgi:hypothetical protein